MGFAEEGMKMKIVLDPTVVMVIAIIVVVLGGGIFLRYRRCPDDRIMVISDKFGSRKCRCIHGKRAFVRPFIQEVQFLDLKPVPVEVDLQGALSRMNNRVGVSAVFKVAVSTDPDVMPNAAEHLVGKELRYVRMLALEIILGQLRIAIARLELEEINARRNTFVSEVTRNIDEELSKIGLKLVETNIADFRDDSELYEHK